MKRLLLTTAIGLALGSAAFAQTAADPSKTETGKPAAVQANTQTPAAAPTSVTLSEGVSVTEPDRTRITESVARMTVKPLRGVDFSVSVGSRVPRELRVYRLPADVVQIVPQYRDYRFLVVEKDIVIVEPSANKIVAILPRDPAITTATAAAPTPPPATVTPAASAPATAAPTAATPTAATLTAVAPTAAAPARTAPAGSALSTLTTATTPAAAASTTAAAAPAASTSSASTPEQLSAQSSQASAEPERPKAKKQASRSQRTSRAARDDARWARAEVRVGQRVPDNIVLHELPPSYYRDLPGREYRTTQRGPRSRLYYESD